MSIISSSRLMWPVRIPINKYIDISHHDKENCEKVIHYLHSNTKWFWHFTLAALVIPRDYGFSPVHNGDYICTLCSTRATDIMAPNIRIEDNRRHSAYFRCCPRCWARIKGRIARRRGEMAVIWQILAARTLPELADLVFAVAD